jgi:hypothetical protein
MSGKSGYSGKNLRTLRAFSIPVKKQNSHRFSI